MNHNTITYILIGLFLIFFFMSIRVLKKNWDRLRNEEKEMNREEKAEDEFIEIHKNTIVNSLDDLKIAFKEYQLLGFKSFRINQFLCDKIQEIIKK